MSPPVSAIRSLRAALWRVLQPYYAAVAARLDRLNFDYHEFLSEETKRKWEWKRRTEQERSFWDAATSFVLGALSLLRSSAHRVNRHSQRMRVCQEEQSLCVGLGRSQAAVVQINCQNHG